MRVKGLSKKKKREVERESVNKSRRKCRSGKRERNAITTKEKVGCRTLIRVSRE